MLAIVDSLGRSRSSRLSFSILAGALALAASPSAANADLLSNLLGPKILSPAPQVSPTTAPAPSACKRYDVMVAMAPGGLANQRVSVELCMPAQNARDAALVTVAGATYSHVYWDFPYQPDHYSFVRHANNAGYATLNIDRLGVGASDHPPSVLFTLDAEAYIGHQLVNLLRSGGFGHTWSKVGLVGHSLGSVISILQAAVYQDVDALVVTGYLHTFGVGLLTAAPNVYPAMLDPRFLTSGLDAGYLTTRPGTRGSIFYDLGNADPGAVAADEATKETVTSLELGGTPASGSVAVSQGVSARVLSVVGEHDSLFCLALPCSDLLNAVTLEPLAYAPAAGLQIIVRPDAGHDLNLQRNAPGTYAGILGWLDPLFPPMAP